MTERGKFEAWCAKRYKNCAYLHTSSTCGDWDAWQAAIASREPMPADKIDDVFASALANMRKHSKIRKLRSSRV